MYSHAGQPVVTLGPLTQLNNNSDNRCTPGTLSSESSRLHVWRCRLNDEWECNTDALIYDTLPALVSPPRSRHFLPRTPPPEWWVSPPARGSAVQPWWALGGPAARTPGPAGPAPPAGPPWAATARATARARPGAAEGRSWPRLQRRCPAAHGGLQSKASTRG